MSKDLARINEISRITQLIESPDKLTNFFDTEKEFLEFRNRLVTLLVGNDPVIMNITVTSDILDYNKLETNQRAILMGNMVKTVSERTSFVYSPSNTTKV